MTEFIWQFSELNQQSQELSCRKFALRDALFQIMKLIYPSECIVVAISCHALFFFTFTLMCSATAEILIGRVNV